MKSVRDTLSFLREKSLALTENLEEEFAKREIRSLCCDSRLAKAGSVFFCLSGCRTDGHFYAAAAYEKGCRVFICERELPPMEDACRILVKDSRLAMAYYAAYFYDFPADRLTLVGITGTKGKTTTALMLYKILNACGIPAGYVGTNGVYYRDKMLNVRNTTPESLELQKTLHDMKAAGVKTVVMEVSSQSVPMHRIAGLRFRLCVFTNLSPDHIGRYEHPTFEDYRDAKKSLLRDYGAEALLMNADDPHTPYMADGCTAPITYFGTSPSCAYRLGQIEKKWRGKTPGSSFDCQTPAGTFSVSLPLPGSFNAMNGLCALAAASLLGVSTESACRAIAQARIPGRFETVASHTDAAVVIDYAHNGVSLSSLFATLRSYRPKRILCVIGSVGGRTEMRRAEIGKALAEGADVAFLTADNPDNEPISQICDDIERAIDGSPCRVVREDDRKRAIEMALEEAREGDILVLAGKGHEAYQLIRGERLHFSERDIVATYLPSSLCPAEEGT